MSGSPRSPLTALDLWRVFAITLAVGTCLFALLALIVNELTHGGLW